MSEKTEKCNPCIGSGADEFFADDGLLEEIEAAAVKRVGSLSSQHNLELAISRIEASGHGT